MNNINDFIREIQTHEVIELSGSLETKVQKKIEKKIFEVIKDEISATVDEKSGDENYKCKKAGHEELKYQKSGDENYKCKKEGHEELKYQKSGDENHKCKKAGHEELKYQKSGDKNYKCKKEGHEELKYQKSGDENHKCKKTGHEELKYQKAGDENYKYKKAKGEELKYQRPGYKNHKCQKTKREESEYEEVKQKAAKYKETEYKDTNFLKEKCRKVKYRKKSRKVWLILAAAISLIFAFGITGAARNQWDLGIVDFMGLEDGESLELYGGEAEIDVSAESHGITLTAVSSIGDKNSAYIRLETDYELPETFNPETDYILPWDVSMHISNKDEQLTKDYASTHMFFEDNGRLCFMLSISDCQDLNQSHVKLQMKDLYLYHDLHQPESTVEEELLFEGTWEVEWTYQYEANAKTCRMIKRFENNGVNYYLTKVEITPISIRIEAFRMPWNREKEHPEDLIQGVIYKDGTKLLIPHQSVCGVRNGMFITQFVDVGVIGEVIKINEIDSIIIGGDAIKIPY